jgi:hypothetical protein
MVTKGLKMWNSWELVQLCQNAFSMETVFLVFFSILKQSRKKWLKQGIKFEILHPWYWVNCSTTLTLLDKSLQYQRI